LKRTESQAKIFSQNVWAVLPNTIVTTASMCVLTLARQTTSIGSFAKKLSRVF